MVTDHYNLIYYKWLHSLGSSHTEPTVSPISLEEIKEGVPMSQSATPEEIEKRLRAENDTLRGKVAEFEWQAEHRILPGGVDSLGLRPDYCHGCKCYSNSPHYSPRHSWTPEQWKAQVREEREKKGA